MAKVITYQETLEQGIVKEGNYVQVTYPDGRKKLFRLVEDGEWIGPPTDDKVIFRGKKGYDNCSKLADNQVKKEYDFPEVFEDVHAFRFQKEEYNFNTYGSLDTFCKDMQKEYIHPDDKELTYGVASRCIGINSSYLWHAMFCVSKGIVYPNYLHWSDGATSGYSCAFRPVVVPRSTMLLQVEGCDGTKENPFICLGSEKNVHGYEKAELQLFIQKGRELLEKSKRLMQEEEENLKELEKIAKML